MTHFPRFLARSLCAAALLCAGGAALAQPAYPNKPIRFVVGFAPGSSIDSVARILADHVKNKLGQPVTVDNRTGANGALAATETINAGPDGYTVLISNSSSITVNPLLGRKLAYDPEKDLAPVALTVTVPFILTTNPEKHPSIRTVAELMAAAKAQPGQMSYGSAGVGNLTQLSFELLNHMAGDVKMTHVPYRGSAPAQMAVLGKEVDAAFDNPAAMPQIQAGKLRALAVSAAQRWPDLPDVPTIAEAGYPGYDISFWVGVFVPAGTPPAVIRTLHEAMASATEVPASKALLARQGHIAMLAPEAFQARIRKEKAEYAAIIKRSNIQLAD